VGWRLVTRDDFLNLVEGETFPTLGTLEDLVAGFLRRGSAAKGLLRNN
jgi:hypothetical protein